MAVKNVVAPKRIEAALTEVLPSLVQFLEQNPEVGTHHHDVHKREIKLWLPVCVGRVMGLSRSKGKRSKGKKQRPGLAQKQVAWLCFLRTGKGVNAAIEVRVEKSGSIRHQFQQGEFIQRIFSRLRSAARSPRLRRSTFAARLWNVPGLYFSALWLKSNSREFFVSLVRLGDGVKAGGFYTRSEIARALSAEVSKRKEAHQFILARKREIKG